MSPTTSPSTVHGSTCEHARAAVAARSRLPGSIGTCRRGGSSAHDSCMTDVSSTLDVHHHGVTLTLNKGRRLVQRCGRTAADQTAFQDTASCAFSHDPKQPMKKAQGQVYVATSVSAKAVDDPNQSSVLGRYQMTRPISRPSSRESTAEHSDTLFKSQYLGATCGDGNGDVKPDHPSGPGTYGHMVPLPAQSLFTFFFIGSWDD